mmetsp:Transcript_7123/g.31484  ORF Transcript_7123/g.31484 Transcript_7123/m.31484 type:complete len:104 (+) Transcript_7123:458-769(+)
MYPDLKLEEVDGSLAENLANAKISKSSAKDGKVRNHRTPSEAASSGALRQLWRRKLLTNCCDLLFRSRKRRSELPLNLKLSSRKVLEREGNKLQSYMGSICSV